MAPRKRKAKQRSIGGMTADAFCVVAIMCAYIGAEYFLLMALRPYDLYRILGFFLVTALFSNIMALFIASRARRYIV